MGWGNKEVKAALKGVMPRLPPTGKLTVEASSKLDRPLNDDVHAVVSVNQGDEGHQPCQLVLVVVVGRVASSVATGRVGDARALFRQLQGRPLGLVNTVVSRPVAIRLRRTEASPSHVASLVCKSVRKPLPLIWPAQIFARSCVAADRVDSVMTLPVQAAQRAPAVDARSHAPSTAPPCARSREAAAPGGQGPVSRPACSRALR